MKKENIFSFTHSLFTAMIAHIALVEPSLAQQNVLGGVSGPFRLEEITYTGGSYPAIVHDELSNWAAYYTPTTFMAVVSASTLSDGLSRADLTIECRDTFAGRTVNFGVGYLLTNGVYPNDQYSLNLFNSIRSGRPASFNIGSGFVRTDHIKFSTLSNESPPKEYVEGTLQLWSGLQSMDESAAFEVRFETDQLAGPYVRLLFPMTAFSEIVQQGKPFCP